MNQRLKVYAVAFLALLYVGLALAAPLTYTSTNVSVTTTSSTIVAAGTNFQTLTVQNTDASNTVYVSFTCPATTSDLKLSAGAAVFFEFAPRNAVCAVGSGTANVSIVGGRL